MPPDNGARAYARCIGEGAPQDRLKPHREGICTMDRANAQVA